jgi:hypothetical protein
MNCCKGFLEAFQDARGLTISNVSAGVPGMMRGLDNTFNVGSSSGTGVPVSRISGVSRISRVSFDQ